MQTDPKRFALTLTALVAAAAFARFVIAFVYTPAMYPDSGTYIRLAEQFLSLDFTGNNGWRTPGYPLLIAAAGLDEHRVWLLQVVMGMAVTIMLFLLVFFATGSLGAAVVAGLAHTLALNQLLLEATILSETMAAFLVVAAIYVADVAWRRGWPPGSVALAAGLGAAAALTRPVYVVIGGVILLVILAFGNKNRLKSGLIFLAVFSLPILIWMAFQKATVGHFGMSTLLGFNLTTHTGAFMERAPEEFAEIRDIYLKHRSQRAAEGRSHAMTIFDAREELEARTGLDDIGLSRELQRVSVRLILDNPARYLQGVPEAWAGFFAVPGAFRPEYATSESVARTIEVTMAAERWILRAGYVAFLLGALPAMWVAWVRRKGSDPGCNTAALLTSIVLAASLMQALLSYGENGRYGLPTQSLAMAAVITVVALALGRRRREVAAGDHPSQRAAVGGALGPVGSSARD